MGKWTLSNRLFLIVVCAGAVIWLALSAWGATGASLSWQALPFGLCLIYVTVRIVYELTIRRFDVPTLATAAAARRQIAGILAQEAAASGKESFVIVDLGSGRGGLARSIAKAVPHANVTGIEQALLPFFTAAGLQRLFGPANLSFERRDFWTFDCRKADAITVYLSPRTMPRLSEKLQKELAPESLVISYAFALLGPWTLIEKRASSSLFVEDLYVYKANLKAGSGRD